MIWFRFIGRPPYFGESRHFVNIESLFLVSFAFAAAYNRYTIFSQPTGEAPKRGKRSRTVSQVYEPSSYRERKLTEFDSAGLDNSIARQRCRFQKLSDFPSRHGGRPYIYAASKIDPEISN